jgi:BirA family biotin operon repressor/biotin-[acetyl-CoA-carboxylase] ligase
LSLNGNPGSFSLRRLEERLEGITLVRRVVVLATVDSTNDELRRLARQGAMPGTVVIADEQQRGRGRRGRDWFSPPARGLYLSLLLGRDDLGEQPTRWTLCAALAACHACRKLSGRDVRIKWPNDLLLGPHKIGGILAEMRSAGSSPLDLVLGIGLNVDRPAGGYPPGLSDTATSLHSGSGEGRPERESLAAELLHGLDEMASRLRGGAWPDVAREWEELAPGARGRRVRIVAPSEAECRSEKVRYEGTTRGLDPGGALLVETPDGELRAVRLAETVVPLE